MSRDVRFYEQKFPEVDDVVMVQVKSIAEMGAYVSLLEYNGIEGMILLSELSRRRIRSITKLIKVGRQEPVMVLRVDKEKGYIDLSKRRVSPEDLKACDEKFNKSKMVHLIARHAAETTGVDLQELQEKVTWPLYKQYGHAFEAFKQVCADPSAIFSKLTNADGSPIDILTPDVVDALVKNIRRRMTPQPLKIRADVEMTCFNYDGVLHIQKAMRDAEATGDEECPVKMKLVAPPLYVLTTQTLDKDVGVEVLVKACEACKLSIEGAKGRLVIKEAARAVSDRDDRLLTEQLEQLEAANREVGGDEDSEEAETQLEADLGMEGSCILENKHVSALFTFQEIPSLKEDGVVKYSNKISEEYAGEYSLFFANCLEDTVVSFDIRVALYNVDASGSPDFLSVGETELPIIYMAMFVLFTVAGAIWTAIVIRNRASAHNIHYLMIALVTLKSLTVLSQAGMFHLIKTTGHPDGWNIAFYVFTFFRGIMFFTVVVLVGTGWSYMKPFIADREKRILMVVIPLQVLANVAIVILDENTPASKTWFTWRDVFHLLDIICCCAILFPIVWSIKHLREASQTDGKAAANLKKLTLFREFYVMVVSYIYFTRIVVYLLKSTTPYQYVWVSDAAGELATLLFYVVTGLKFQPASNNPYFAVSTSDIEMTQ